MKILAFEFSSSKRSVAIIADGHVRGYAEVEYGQTTPALALVDQTLKAGGLKRDEIERIAVGLGPGSYTGVRMSLALTQGFAMAGNIEAVGISSMLALATDASRLESRTLFHVAVDAQRGEFYLGDYEVSAGCVREPRPLRIVRAAEILNLLKSGELVFTPDLAPVLPEARLLHPDARAVGRLGEAATAVSAIELLKPIYLRQTTFVKPRDG